MRHLSGIKISEVRTHKQHIDGRRELLRKSFVTLSVVFVMAYLLLFFGMSLHPNVYDEGIMLTGAMRVVAGQIPHRDFYANYGPAQFYILAGLFRLFGVSLLVARLYDLLVEAFLITSIYSLISFYCSRSVAICVSIAGVLYLFAFESIAGTPVLPVSLISLIGSAIILPVFLRAPSTRRMLLAGALAGMTGLFRYDIGFALLATHACVIAIAISLRVEGTSGRLRAFCSAFWPYLLGVAIVFLPPALYYLSVAPLHDFVHDIVLYPSQYYYRGRSLPFPKISLKAPDNIAVYLPIVIVAIAIYVAATRLTVRLNNTRNLDKVPEEQNRLGCLITFGLLALVMYFKGWVRASPVHMYLSIIPSLFVIAVLCRDRFATPHFIRVSIMGVALLSMLAPALCAVREAIKVHRERAFALVEMLPGTSADIPVILAWCKIVSPLTRGFCFTSDADRIKTIEFIVGHTTSNQRLYVGLTRHDKIFANDSLIYFASQRLPATKWSHFDPGLQNSRSIQVEMIHELEENAPPYAVLDSEFDLVSEPNDSSKSSGVMLLDEYLQKKYCRVSNFGEFSVWHRITTP